MFSMPVLFWFTAHLDLAYRNMPKTSEGVKYIIPPYFPQLKSDFPCANLGRFFVGAL